MSYGLSPELFLENGPAVEAAKASAGRRSSRFRAWQTLDSEGRLALVEKALGNTVRELADGYPAAL